MSYFEITARNDRVLPFAVLRSGAPEDLTGAQLWFTAIGRATGTVIARSTSDLGIEVTDAIAGLARVILEPSDTASVAATEEFDTEVQLQTATGQIETIARGTLKICKRLTP
jgi:hypothetical protein